MDRTRCCVVGAGPAGAMLALLLARLGIAVTLLEGHADFEREFRGDTLHPSTLASSMTSGSRIDFSPSRTPGCRC